MGGSPNITRNHDKSRLGRSPVLEPCIFSSNHTQAQASMTGAYPRRVPLSPLSLVSGHRTFPFGRPVGNMVEISPCRKARGAHDDADGHDGSRNTELSCNPAEQRNASHGRPHGTQGIERQHTSKHMRWSHFL